MTTNITTRLNDVDLQAVGQLIQAIEADGEKAETTWRATVDWESGFRSTGTVRDFAPIRSDEPTGLGGSDTAPNPVEQLLAALGNCLAVGYAANLSGAGVQIRRLRIDLEGDLDLHTFLGLTQGHAGFSDIRATVHLDADAEPETLASVHEKVVSTSPVGHTLSRPVPVTVELA